MCKTCKEKAAIGLVASAAVCAFICGVTEPFEFGFMFLGSCSVRNLCITVWYLYYDHSCSASVRDSASHGAMDLLFSSSPAAAQKIWLESFRGRSILVFYFVFLFAIKKWDLKTPDAR